MSSFFPNPFGISISIIPTNRFSILPSFQLFLLLRAESVEKYPFIMSKRNKLQKFSELLTFPNVFENFDIKQPELVGENGMPVEMKGKWRENFFKNENPITLELACGRGEYTLALARRYPERNFIGVDIKGARIWKGAKTALNEDLTNVAFLRTRIERIDQFFAREEVDEIWITFPDPFLRKSKANRRLTSPVFLRAYRKIIRAQGTIHLKTDEPNLYEYSLEVLSGHLRAKILHKSEDIYAGELPFEELEIKTYYEKMHLREGKKIKYIRFYLLPLGAQT
jgi:tRNA (guanine-N7-)-methyltransferase